MDTPLERLSPSMRNNVLWCEHNYHKLSYSHGNTSQESLENIRLLIKMLGMPLISKGPMKVEFLRRFFQVEVFDITEEVTNCPTFLDMSKLTDVTTSDFCQAHRGEGEGGMNPHCSQYKTKLLGEFIEHLESSVCYTPAPRSA